MTKKKTAADKKLTELERLTLVALQAEERAVKAEAGLKLQTIEAGRNALAARVGARLKVQLKDYTIDLPTGKLTKREDNNPPAPIA